MRKGSLWCLCGILILSEDGSGKPLPVVVNASADQSYLETVADRPYQTYHFLEGQYYSGEARDPSLRKISFAQVAETTAKYLSEQKFYPAANKDVGDLLIMVSWGTTQLDLNYNDLLGVTDLGGGAEIGSAGVQGGSQLESAEELSQIETVDEQTPYFDGYGAGGYETRKNLKMLGFDKGIYDDEASQFEIEKWFQELGDERYFIVLNAFDLKHFREKKELKEVWSCRFSTRNLGTNFIAALDFMNAVAAPMFGKNMDKLLVQNIDPKSKVKIGELKVIGTAEEN